MANMSWIPFVLFGLFVCCTSQCPPAELLVPCTCADNTFFVACTEITDMEVLSHVFERSSDYAFRDFQLSNSSLLYLPASKMAFKRVKRLLVINTTMAGLFDTELPEGNRLELVWLLNVTFQRGVGWDLFLNLKNLQSFKAQNSEIKSLGKDFSDNISPGITQFILEAAGTRKIQRNAFVKLKNLVYLEISYGRIKSLSRSMFPSPAAIEMFNFRGNQITSLPDDLFSQMPTLKTINLMGNQITVLSETVFGPVYDKIFQVLVEDNPINCDCTVRWLLKKLITKQGALHGTCGAPENKKGEWIAWLAYDDYSYCEG